MAKILAVSAVLAPHQRAEILSRVTPAFTQVYCMQFTWAYRVSPGFGFPSGEIELSLDGIYRGDDADVLIGSIKGAALTNGPAYHLRHRPDGKLVHVTLSTRPGTPPAASLAGMPERPAWQTIAPIVLNIRLARRNATTLRPDNMAA